MRKHPWPAWAALACAALVVSSAAAQEPADDVFDFTRVWQIHLDLTAKDYQQLQPAGGMRFPFGPKPAEKPAEKNTDVHKGAGGFNLEFPWARAEMTADGTKFPNVGVRYKGNFTYLASANQL